MHLSQRLAAMLAVLALVLSDGSLAVVCLHADGTAEIEQGADLCCLSTTPGDTGGRLASSDGRCPGCADVALSWSAEKPRRESNLPLSASVSPRWSLAALGRAVVAGAAMAPALAARFLPPLRI